MVPKSWIGFGLVWDAKTVSLPGVVALQFPLRTRGHGSGEGLVRLMPSDAAILESSENRKDLPCTVTPDKPILGFDLKYHLGYEVTVPIKELVGSDNQLTMVFRVTPENQRDGIYFSQHVRGAYY
ncbi:MAG: hypothetical protein WDO73_31365 [Ignavibacteriota bacterium]